MAEVEGVVRVHVGVSRERFERAAEELYKLDRDCGRVPTWADTREPVPWSEDGLDASWQFTEVRRVRLIYLRRALTVLRHAGIEADVPPELLERRHAGGCAPGYCRRAMDQCTEGVCHAVC